MYASVDPSTGELLETFDTHSPEEVEAALSTSQAMWREDWRQRSFVERAALFEALAQLLEAQSSELGELMALEMGKPVAQGVAEARKCAWVCRFYAEQAESFLQPVPHTSDGSEAYVRYDSIGPVLAIMPWNFPFWQVLRFAAPTMMAGNTAILKHAPNTPRCAERIASLFAEAGFPEGSFFNLRLTNEQAAEVIADNRIAGVTLTGSTLAGRIVSAEGGRALKPMVMELGGSDPFIVFEDADLSRALAIGVASRTLNNGQSCIAAKRFLLHESIVEPFVEGLHYEIESMCVGAPTHMDTQIGPLARKDLRDELAAQVQRALDAGATAICGASVPQRNGFFYNPTLLVDVDDENPAIKEELFGPVVVVQTFADEAEAVRKANATEYGLGASLWTEDRKRIQRLLPQLEAGNVFVNGMVKSDPRLPFGGSKASGFGRELGREGILAFVNAKTVWIA